MKKVFVGILNWGLGHATRMKPIITWLIQQGHEVHLGSDGRALAFLKHQYPDLRIHEMPSYAIKYPNNSFLLLKLLIQLPKISKAIKSENQFLRELHQKENFDICISDNRLGLGGIAPKSYYITHQLNIQVPFGEVKANEIHHDYIKKYDLCLVPDYNPPYHITGKLGVTTKLKNVHYIGPLSHLNRLENNLQNDVCIILSGPEPQRSLFEEIILNQIANVSDRIVIVRGVTEGNSKYRDLSDNVKIVDYLSSEALTDLISRSRKIISRSGYSTIMDMYLQGKPVFFVPTPGQTEQEYLAKRLNKYFKAPFSMQSAFDLRLASQLAHPITMDGGIHDSFCDLIN